jgi:hypothetical protein
MADDSRGIVASEVSGSAMDAEREAVMSKRLDCYPYTFSPLLLFAPSDYFDKGYSNYHSVAQFFQSVVEEDMLQNVLTDRKNMLYEELLQYILDHQMLVICCIDAHFTGFQILQGGSKPVMLYYDPLDATLQLYKGTDCITMAIFLLLKCSYADSQHIQDNRDHYVSATSGAVRRRIHTTWKNINQVDKQYGLRSQAARLNLDRYLLVNDPASFGLMSTQQTGNTCYFQTFLYVCLLHFIATKSLLIARRAHAVSYFVFPPDLACYARWASCR